MPKPTLLGQHLKTSWLALTEQQRLAWQYWAMGNPVTSLSGRKIALYGYQAYVQTNSLLGAMDTTLILDDPPFNRSPPPLVKVRAINWQKKSRLANTTTAYHGLAYLQLVQPLPAACNLMVKQSYASISRSSRRAPRTRHVTYAKPGEPSDINLQVPRGYYASTAGANKFASIKGRTARRKKHLPFARVIVIDTTTGAWREQFVDNPG